MRLEVQLDILEKAIKKLNIAFTQNPNNSNLFIITNLPIVKEGLNEILCFNYLNPELQEAIGIDYFYNFAGEKLVLQKSDFDRVRTLIENLKYKIRVNIDILKSMIVPAEELTLCIKIVECDSLKDIATDLSTLDKIISQVITHKNLNGEYKFSNFGIGSSWVYIVLNTVITYGVIASVIWSASVIRKKILEGNISNEYLKQMKLKTESMDDIKEAQKELIRKCIEAEAINIMSTHNLEDTDHEYKGRLIYAIKELSELIMRGVEIQPSTISTEDVKNLLPNFDKLDLIESKIKLLENK